jgi:FSR family fosmidomycin resistance protein-like MFS transporter
MSTSASSSIQKTAYPILFAIAFGHLLNDLIQGILQPMFPMIKETQHLDYSQVGLIMFAFQITSSLFQPVVGSITDKYPQPYSFSFGMLFAISGVILLSFANSFPMTLAAACSIGIGSSIFHPEASRVAYSASGGRRSLAQSIFQLGGNAGTALGPLLVAAFVLPFGQKNTLWFVLAGVLGFGILLYVSNWYKGYLKDHLKNNAARIVKHSIPKKRVQISVVILLVLLFSKYFYTASISSYFIFYVKEKFNVQGSQGQLLLAVYLSAMALGTVIGGIVGDRYGRKAIIWFSILGSAPFSLLLPHMDLTGTVVCLGFAGFILASAFPSILVYAQELLPGRIGMISGLFYGFAFGMGGIGAACLGGLIDMFGIEQVYFICSFLPLMGIIAAFLPSFKNNTTDSGFADNRVADDGLLDSE